MITVREQREMGAGTQLFLLSVQSRTPAHGTVLHALSLPNLELSSPTCPETSLLGGPSSLLVAHHTCLEQSLESKENSDIRVVFVELPYVSLLR